MPVLPADRATRRELSAPFRGGDDRSRRAILHRATGVHELGFAEDLAAGLLTYATKPDQRRVADRPGKSVRDTHTKAPCDIDPSL
jgi:hypothetical protein